MRQEPAPRLGQLLSATTVTAVYSVVLAFSGAWSLSAFSRPVAGPTTAGWLQVAAMSLPVTVLAVWAAGRFSRTLAGGTLQLWLRATTMAFAGAASVAVADTVRAGLTTSPAQQQLLAHVVRGTTFLLPVALVLTVGLDVLMAIGVPERSDLLTALRRTGFAVCAGALLVGTAGVLPMLQASSANAIAPASPCPAGAPTKSFDVRSVDVDIPLNRFGDHDPSGKMYVLSDRVAAVRAEEASQKVSIGLRDDPIQPLVIRANQGECVSITYTNQADGGSFGLHIDGLSFLSGSSGDAIGRNAASNPAKGESRTYTYWVPVDPTLEGAHYMHPGPGFRDSVNHGLFGSLVVEPPGSTYLDPNIDPNGTDKTPKPLVSGWEAIIRPGAGAEFRENVQLYHEIGNENEKDAVLQKNGNPVPFVDPHTDAYRPDTRAISYRSEGFYDRLEYAPGQEAHAYGSYTFSDPATPMPRGYRSDPTKFRILHAGAELFHVFHMHGGGIRWRFNPTADPTWDYSETGLDKHPLAQTDSERLDSQSFGPGESYNLEIEGGAGGVQQGAGDFLFHCHIAEHYVAGMWSFWRVYDTLQPEFAPLTDRVAPPTPVDSTQLVGKTYGPAGNQQTITAANLDAWIRPQLAPRGVRRNSQDATVWNWGKNPANPSQFLGEPEDNTNYPDYYKDPSKPGHPTALPVDTFVGNRPVMLFNPENGRPAYPLMRPHLGMRPPWAPSGHSGAPYLGEMGSQTARTDRAIDPYAGRDDGICPAQKADGTPTDLRRFNVVAVEKPVKVTTKDVDPTGMIYTLAHDKNAVLSGRKPFEPLALRANVGDCVAVTLTSELTDENAAGHFSQVNMHIHHVQFDTQSSDGVITGMSYEQAVRPYKVEDPRLTAPAAAGDTVLHLSDVSKFQKGVAIGVGLGTEGPAAHGTVNPVSGNGPEVRSITAINPAARTVTLSTPLAGNHAQGQWAGTEFTQYRWYPDVDLDNIFWHDHVDGIHTWAHGLVGQLITEPQGSTYHDPRTGKPVDSGTIVDIHTDHPLAAAAGVSGSFREMALWTMDKGFGSTVDSMLNLRAAPLTDRGADPFSSYRWGDPLTPLPRAYKGDPFVIRTINVGPTVDTLHVDGHDFMLENRYVDANRLTEGGSTNTIHYGISEKFTLILGGGAGGKNQMPGDYLYFNGVDRRLNDGAWGIIRVLPGRIPSANQSDPNYLQPLPGTTPGVGPAVPSFTGAAPPKASGPGNPCPAGSPVHAFDVTAIRKANAANPVRYAFVPTAQVGSPAAGSQPLVMHVAVGECVSVKVTNSTKEPSIGFHLSGLSAGTPSSGVNVGYNPDTTIAAGAKRSYTYYVDNPKFSGGAIADMVGDDLSKRGLYGAYTVAPAHSTFTDPVTGRPRDVGEAVNVHTPDGSAYRDFSLVLSDDEKQIGASFMPYPVDVERPESDVVNYRRSPRDDTRGDAFSSSVFGDPKTPILSAYAGDPVVVNTLVAPGSEQMHSLNLGGLSFSLDPNIHGADTVETRGVGPWEMLTAKVVGGAGGRAQAPGDYFYGDMRRVFTKAGMWGLQRVLPADTPCPATGTGALLCLSGPNSTAPNSTAPGVTDPGTTDPAVTDPGVTDPAVTDPGTTDPAGTGGEPASAPAARPTINQRDVAWVGKAVRFTGRAKPGTAVRLWFDSARSGVAARRLATTRADATGHWSRRVTLADSGVGWATSGAMSSSRLKVSVHSRPANTLTSARAGRLTVAVVSPHAASGARFVTTLSDRSGTTMKVVRGLLTRRGTGRVADIRVPRGVVRAQTRIRRDPLHAQQASRFARLRVL